MAFIRSRFDSIFDSLRCCALSHPVFSLFAQTIFKLLDFSTENTQFSFNIFELTSFINIHHP